MFEQFPSRKPEYRAWDSMKYRCYNPNSLAYKNYGSRGIKVCQRWMESFDAFYEDMGPRPEGTTLERKDNNGPYSPDNCKWGTWKEQNRNSRHNRILEFNGKSMSLAAWSEEMGLTGQSLFNRLKRGWSIERALTQKARNYESRNPSIRQQIRAAPQDY